MKKLVLIILLLGSTETILWAQDYPNVTQKYRYLPYYSPAMAGVNDYLDLNVGFNVQPSGLNNSLNTNFFSGYYSTGSSQQSRNAIRGTQSVDDYFSRRKSVGLKFGFGTSIFNENTGYVAKTYNSNTVAIHIPVAEHTYISFGAAAGFNFANADVEKILVERKDDPVYQRYLDDGSNTSFHLDLGLAAISDNFYFAVGLNNVVNGYLSGNEDLTRKIIVTNFMGGYRVLHSNDLEIIVMSQMTTQQDFETTWHAGARARYRQILMAGFNFAGQGAIITQFGLQANDYINIGYSFNYKTSSTAVVSSIHEIGIGIRLMNNNKYSPIW
jgi:type IX secretion system PorP/SprF family membrane protein